MDFLSAKPSLPMAVTANASVTDVNRQQWSAAAAMIVHPSSLYVGLKAKRPFVEKGTPFDLDVIGCDLDGKAAPGAKIDVRAVRMDWEYKRGTYTTKEVDPQDCAVTAAAAATPCTFQTKQGGTYQITATIVRREGPREYDDAHVLGQRRRQPHRARGAARSRAAHPGFARSTPKAIRRSCSCRRRSIRPRAS